MLATKIEAFHGRGNKDFLGSHDFEDIVTVVAGRFEIADEIAQQKAELKQYIKDFFNDIISNTEFITALPGHVSDGPIMMQRVQTVINRIKKIISS